MIILMLVFLLLLLLLLLRLLLLLLLLLAGWLLLRLLRLLLLIYIKTPGSRYERADDGYVDLVSRGFGDRRQVYGDADALVGIGYFQVTHTPALSRVGGTKFRLAGRALCPYLVVEPRTLTLRKRA